jgi:hypothetical protein
MKKAEQPDIPIFLSIGRRSTDVQVTVVNRITSVLAQLGLDLQVPTEEPWAFNTGLEHVQSQMAMSHGVLVVAFTRYYYERGVEWPNSAKQRPVENRNLPTVWLQIEAALALQMRLPLLILVEDALHLEALLNPKHRADGVTVFNTAECQSGLPDALVTALSEFARKVTERMANQQQGR